MPARKSNDQAEQPTDEASAQVQKAFDEAEAKGYIGTVPDQPDNKEFSLLSGPNSPTLVPDSTTRVVQPEPRKEG